MNIDEHSKLTRNILGEPYREVHRWLDEKAGEDGPLHRQYRHHWEGALECADELTKRNDGDYDDWLDYLRASLEHIAQDMVHDPLPGDPDSPRKQFPVPRRSDYEGGVGNWPTVEPWWPGDQK